MLEECFTLGYVDMNVFKFRLIGITKRKKRDRKSFDNDYA